MAEKVEAPEAKPEKAQEAAKAPETRAFFFAKINKVVRAENLAAAQKIANEIEKNDKNNNSKNNNLKETK